MTLMQYIAIKYFNGFTAHTFYTYIHTVMAKSDVQRRYLHIFEISGSIKQSKYEEYVILGRTIH